MISYGGKQAIFGPFNWVVATASPDVSLADSAAETPTGTTLTHPESLGVTAVFQNLNPIDITFTPGDVSGQPTPDATFYLDPTIINETGHVLSGFSLQLVGTNPGHFEEFPNDTEHPDYPHFHDAVSGMFASPQIGSLSIDGSNDYGYIPNVSGGIDRESKATLSTNSAFNEIYTGDTCRFRQYFGTHAVAGDGAFTLELTPIIQSTPLNFFNGEAGILWQNTSSGDVQLWNSSGTGGFAAQDLGVLSGWQIVGTGDFNGSGEAGILWQNTSSGDVQLWNSNGSGGFSTQDLGVHSGWQIVGTGDFNGSGADGILWQNSSSGDVQLWNSNGTGGFISEDGFTNEDFGVLSGWQVVGTGNFNGNGADGILWQNSSSGDFYMWNPNGLGTFTGENLGVLSGWQVVGTGDFNGNGADGILWRNTSSGDIQLWNPRGAGGFTTEDFGVHPGWQIVGTGDFNGSGADGILWQNTSSGDVQLWNSKTWLGGLPQRGLGR